MVAPRCDACGKFFSMLDSSASITMITPDSAYTFETYESLCGKCARSEELEAAVRSERERCAKVCEEMAVEAAEYDTATALWFRQAAARIRAHLRLRGPML